jgi:hypothetical protein
VGGRLESRGLHKIMEKAQTQFHRRLVMLRHIFFLIKKNKIELNDICHAGRQQMVLDDRRFQNLTMQKDANSGWAWTSLSLLAKSILILVQQDNQEEGSLLSWIPREPITAKWKFGNAHN